MDKITERLYLGSWKDCKNCLEDPRWEIVSVAVDATVHGPNFFPISDGGREDTDWGNFEAAVHKVIQLLCETDKPVLVHCQSGVNRSPSVVISTLLFLRPNSSLKDIYELVLSKRPRIFPFDEQLRFAVAAAGRDWDAEQFRRPVVVLSETEEAVNSLYKEILGRSADPDGLLYYSTKVQSGRTDLEGLRATLLRSEEYKRKNEKVTT